MSKRYQDLKTFLMTNPTVEAEAGLKGLRYWETPLNKEASRDFQLLCKVHGFMVRIENCPLSRY